MLQLHKRESKDRSIIFDTKDYLSLSKAGFNEWENYKLRRFTSPKNIANKI